MNKEFLKYEQALELKELGFNEPCVAYYTADAKQLSLVQGYDSLMFADYVHLANTVKSIPCPLYQQAFRFFREKFDLFGCIDLQVCTPAHWFIRIDEISKNDYIFHSEDENYKFNNYEEAELECLKKLIEIVKLKK